jgi:nickel transport protein
MATGAGTAITLLESPYRFADITEYSYNNHPQRPFMKIMIKQSVTLGLTLGLMVLTSLGFAAPAFAHTVETNYFIADQAKLETNTRFSSGEPFTLAPVKVFSPTNLDKPWLEGKTDTQGMFAFTPDRKLNGDWQVAIGEGNHADALTLAVSNQDVQIREIQEKQAANPWGRQLIVVGFVAVAGGLGKLFSSKRG